MDNLFLLIPKLKTQTYINLVALSQSRQGYLSKRIFNKRHKADTRLYKQIEKELY